MVAPRISPSHLRLRATPNAPVSEARPSYMSLRYPLSQQTGDKTEAMFLRSLYSYP